MFLATSKVEDFNRWWSVFTTTSLEKRKQHGSKGSHIFRDPNEEGRVWVLFDWDAEGWQNFISDPEVPAILQEAGHASRPQIAELAGYGDDVAKSSAAERVIDRLGDRHAERVVVVARLVREVGVEEREDAGMRLTRAMELDFAPEALVALEAGQELDGDGLAALVGLAAPDDAVPAAAEALKQAGRRGRCSRRAWALAHLRAAGALGTDGAHLG